VIAILALEDFTVRRYGTRPADMAGGPTSNKFHCKALNGLFEGLASGSVVIYAYWTMAMNITSEHKDWEPMLLLSTSAILMISCGLGLLELDYSISRTVARRMRQSYRYEIIHGLFRISEVILKVVLVVWFLASARLAYGVVFCVPIFADFFVTFTLIMLYSGAETTVAVSFLCAVPCMFTNIFLFIDSPYKCRAAKRLSNCLIVKNAVFMFLLPGLVFGHIVWFMPRHQGCQDMIEKERTAWKQHMSLVLGMLVLVPLYWALLGILCIHKKVGNRARIPDIYSCCAVGDTAALRDVIRKLTHQSAVGVDMNMMDPDGYTPLMLAAAAGHTQVCRLLIQEGADVSVRALKDWNRAGLAKVWLTKAARRSWTALHLAAFKGHAGVLEVLLENSRVEIQAYQDRNLDTPLHIAAIAGHKQAAAIIASRRPLWVPLQNHYNELAVDIAASHDVARAIMQPESALNSQLASVRSNHFHRHSRGGTGGGSGGGEPLLRNGLSSGGITATSSASSQSSVLGSVDEQWASVQLPINRLRTDTAWIAPGLCSYILSVCGGVLGRVHVRHVPSTVRQEDHLSVISEMSEDALSTAEEGRPTGDMALPASASNWWRRSFDVTNPEDLLPVDAEGRVNDTWLLELSDTTTSKNAEPYAVRRFYRVPQEAELGRGAYGVVWRAQHKLSQDRYAVKVMHANTDDTIASREYQVADRIRHIPHPSLVQLFHAHRCSDVGLYLLVMEFCDGGDLFCRISRVRDECKLAGRSYKPPHLAKAWIPQIFLGLEHMHKRMNTLLRDLKPQNVVLDGFGRAKLTDFGFGRFGVEPRGGWSFGFPTGSPGFVAPEILRQKAHDALADLYSFGVLVWLLQTGGLKHLSFPCPPISKRAPHEGIEKHVQDCHLLARCVADPERNYSERLGSDKKDFVQRLISENPANRMNHEQIRNHKYFKTFEVPSFHAPPACVEDWVQRSVAGLSSNTSNNLSRNSIISVGTGSTNAPATPR